MAQKVDVWADGVHYNAAQNSANPALVARVVRLMQTADRLEVVRSLPAKPPPPPPSTLDHLLQNCIWVAEVQPPDLEPALALPVHWSFVVSADPAYRTPLLEVLIHRALAQGRRVHPWADCREAHDPSPGTPFRVAVMMRQLYGLFEPVGEAESPLAYARARAAGARLLIGNPSALTPAQLAEATELVAAGEIAFTGEMLAPDPTYSARGIDIAAVTLYVGPGGGVYHALDSLLAACTPAQRETFNVYHLHALRDGDRRRLT